MARAWLIFALGALHFFVSQLYRTANAVLAPALVRDLGVDTEGLGLMAAAFFYSFALAQIPITLFIDRIGAKRLMIAFAFVGIAGGLAFSLAEGLALAVAGRLLLGVGMACNLMGPLKLLTQWFPPRTFATLSGALYAIGTLGNMVSATPLVLMVASLGWRPSFQLIVAVHLLLTLALFFVVREPPAAPGAAAEKRPASPFENLGRLLKSRDYWIISAGTFVRYGSFAALQALWAGPLLMELLGYPPVAAGNILLMLSVGMIAGGPLWGAAIDRLFRTPKGLIAGGMFALAALTLLLSWLPAGTPAPAAGLLFFLLGLASSTGLHVYAHIKSLLPAGMAGAAMSGTNFFTMLGPAVFLQAMGIVMQRLHPEAPRGPQAFATALVLLAACQAAIGIAYLFTRRR
jgi:predicted MFS family arabinose efflux permease